jgi:bacillithiol system protein YtxJ
MKLFNIFKSEAANNQETPTNWKPLTSVNAISDIVEASYNTPQLIFKHSTRCGISKMVLKQFEKEFNWENSIDTYFLDLLQNRDISNEIASKFVVQHESPQVLLIKDGVVVAHASHGDINTMSF